MPSSRQLSRLPIAGLLVMMALVLGWLLLVYGSDRTGEEPLPGRSGSTVEYFADPGGRLTREEVARLAPESWRQWSGEGYLRILNTKVLWAKIVLRNSGNRPLQGVLENNEYFVDHVDAWVQDEVFAEETGEVVPVWRLMRSGQIIPLKYRPLWGRDTAFPVTVPARGSSTVYLRVADAYLPNLLPVWWPDQGAYQAMRGRELLADALYLGGLLALLGYNTMLWLRMRLDDIGYYALYLGMIGLFMFIARARLPELGWAPGATQINILLNTAIVLSAVFLTQFARVFLELHKQPGLLGQVPRALLTVLLILTVAVLAAPWLGGVNLTQTVVTAAGLTHVGLLAVALWAWRIGIRQARFFVLAFGFLFAGSLPAVLVWLTNSVAKNATIMGLMTGSALEMLLLSLATADRFVLAQREREEAQARLVEETEQRRAVEEAYADELEVEVRERTRELEATNTDKDRIIAVIGHDLRSPLTGLTQAAEQLAGAPAEPAELGRFAGDSARVGREMLLLIEDLVLWARLRAGLQLPPGHHQMEALVTPVVALHRTIAEQRGIALAVAVPAELPVETDLVLAQTLLRNLVANALKFSRYRVTVGAHAEAGGVRVTVSDDGPGLPPAVAAGLAGEMTGMEGGLGLRLCVEISRALGTELEAGPGDDGGTVFSFVLPVRPAGPSS